MESGEIGRRLDYEGLEFKLLKFEAVFTLEKYILQKENASMKFSISMYFFSHRKTPQ